MREYTKVTHTFEPVYNKNSKILILGTFPSVKSRETNFYYGHSQNRFWKVMAELTGSELPATIEEKKKMLLFHHIAIWDVIESCSIVGSSDSTIRDVVVNDFSEILNCTQITNIYANGNKAYELYMKYAYPTVLKPITKLPSTSPANAVYRIERLCAEWGALLNLPSLL